MSRKSKLVVLASGVMTSAAGVANAAVDASISTAISTMQADAVTIATSFTVAIIAVVAIKFLRKGL